ncbi:hypothetical protein [Psychroserpens ponticola]|uniref:DUF4386 family protein n=1 Tax=Psychroserpens ponticola TaxID=2932268 RepID=A0ABY7RVX3_9FLAO|nr:hypothetical protein [Psychroserpens ponticola]WCO00988.1 hypothetical protein MUN68_013025 [Psychroserpens ponticola]
MNYNIITYSIYLPIIAVIMVKVGWLFYTHGEIFLLYLFQQNTSLVKSINNILLIGYYLVNLGYAIISLAYWETIESVIQMLNTLGEHLGVIIIGLSLLHYNNVLLLNYLVKSKTLKL